MEYLVWVITVFAAAVIGVIIGIWIGMERMRKAIEEQSLGNLRIDRSEPDEPPRPFLELTGCSIESLSKKDFAILKIVNESYLSQN